MRAGGHYARALKLRRARNVVLYCVHCVNISHLSNESRTQSFSSSASYPLLTAITLYGQTKHAHVRTGSDPIKDHRGHSHQIRDPHNPKTKRVVSSGFGFVQLPKKKRFTYDIHGGVNVTASPVSSSEEARKQRQPPILTIPGSKTRRRRRERAMPLFKSSPKSPQELAKGLKEALGVLSSGGAKRAEKAAEEAAKILGQIKVGLHSLLSGHLPVVS